MFTITKAQMRSFISYVALSNKDCFPSIFHENSTILDRICCFPLTFYFQSSSTEENKENHHEELVTTYDILQYFKMFCFCIQILSYLAI